MDLIIQFDESYNYKVHDSQNSPNFPQPNFPTKCHDNVKIKIFIQQHIVQLQPLRQRRDFRLIGCFVCGVISLLQLGCQIATLYTSRPLVSSYTIKACNLEGSKNNIINIQESLCIFCGSFSYILSDGIQIYVFPVNGSVQL